MCDTGLRFTSLVSPHTEDTREITMKLFVLTLMAFVISITAIPYAFAPEKLNLPFSIVGPSRVQFTSSGKRPAFVLEISEDCKYNGDWREDHFLLEIIDPENRRVFLSFVICTWLVTPLVASYAARSKRTSALRPRRDAA
jgi:hypothetical protein